MRRVHYVLSAHWDREWYQSFQDYRYRLVKLIDGLFEGWQSGRLCGPFHTDGQSIVLEDYLEIRPERTREVEQAAREGRFRLGPFYVQPDEFLVSGESLIRNLQIGRQAARNLGAVPSAAGLLCDNFGHTSQMPQILAGFGIRAGFVWRGTNLPGHRLFTWCGADGTELPCYRFGLEGYCGYAKFVRQQRLDEPPFTPEQIDGRLLAFLDGEDAKTATGPLLAFDGGDHMAWDTAAYEVLRDRMESPDGRYEIVHSSLDEYMEEMLAARQAAGETGPVLEGELREPGRFPLSEDNVRVALAPGSSRVWIKQANAACETLLTRWAEPFAAFAAWAAGLPYPHGFLEHAWKWLLQNHAHDSICGCSIDAVHEDMAFRFRQAGQIAERQALEAVRALAASVQSSPGEGELRCTVFNPLPRPFQGTAVLNLEIPVEWPGSVSPENREGLPGFRIFGPDRREIPHQRLGAAFNQARLRIFETAFPRPYRVHEVAATLPLEIPALGYTSLTLRSAGASPLPVFPKPDGAVTAGLRSLENEHLAVTFEANGALSLLDKRQGQTYRDLLTFEDSADTGDGWNHGQAINDRPRLSAGCPVEIERLASGPFAGAFLVRARLAVPEEFDFAAQQRSERNVELVIESRVTLRVGADQVEIEVTLHNNARDHRLRVFFPSGVQADTYLADVPFDAVERRVGLPPENDLYRQAAVETRPQQTWTAVSDGRRGLAVISTGLYESAVLDLPERPVALTLLRATRRTVHTSGEPGGQVQGSLSFRCALKPFAGPASRADLFDRGAALAAGLRIVCLAPLDVKLHRQPVELLPSGSFLALEGPLVLTCLRRTGNGLEARLFNPDSVPARGKLHLPAGVENRERVPVWVDFEGRPLDRPVEMEGRTVSCELRPKEIRTLWFE